MQKNKSGRSVFYRNFSSCVILLVVYVDGIVITGSKEQKIGFIDRYQYDFAYRKSIGKKKSPKYRKMSIFQRNIERADHT